MIPNTHFIIHVSHGERGQRRGNSIFHITSNVSITAVRRKCEVCDIETEENCGEEHLDKNGPNCKHSAIMELESLLDEENTEHPDYKLNLSLEMESNTWASDTLYGKGYVADCDESSQPTAMWTKSAKQLGSKNSMESAKKLQKRKRLGKSNTESNPELRSWNASDKTLIPRPNPSISDTLYGMGCVADCHDSSEPTTIWARSTKTFGSKNSMGDDKKLQKCKRLGKSSAESNPELRFWNASDKRLIPRPPTLTDFYERGYSSSI